MTYYGFIRLDRELVYSIARKLTDLFEHRAGLMLAEDGKTITWDTNRNITDIEFVLADAMEILRRHHITGVGLIKCCDDDRELHDIVVIKNMVKVSAGGKIRSIMPTPT